MSFRVLIADDDPTLRELFGFYFRALDSVIVASGTQAVAEFKRQPFDFVLLDMMMPEMNGGQTGKLIRELDMGVPIGFFTGFGEDARADADVLACRPIRIWIKPHDLYDMAEYLYQLNAQSEEGYLTNEPT